MHCSLIHLVRKPREYDEVQVDELMLCSIAFGGVHLPDLTVITPVFDSTGKDIIFWTASRGHHADVSPFCFSIFPE